MCNQAVSLLQGEIERAGIATVSISLLRDITERVRPPRALVVPFPHGYPLGAPDDPELQKHVLRGALSLLSHENGRGPLIEDWRHPANGPS